jgi:hypothetical protein
MANTTPMAVFSKQLLFFVRNSATSSSGANPFFQAGAGAFARPRAKFVGCFAIWGYRGICLLHEVGISWELGLQVLSAFLLGDRADGSLGPISPPSEKTDLGLVEGNPLEWQFPWDW